MIVERIMDLRVHQSIITAATATDHAACFSRLSAAGLVPFSRVTVMGWPRGGDQRGAGISIAG